MTDNKDIQENAPAAEPQQAAVTAAAPSANWHTWMAAVAAVLALTGITAVAATWRKTLTALGSRRMFFTLPWLAATRPACNLALKVRCLLFPGKNYTWN